LEEKAGSFWEPAFFRVQKALYRERGWTFGVDRAACSVWRTTVTAVDTAVRRTRNAKRLTPNVHPGGPFWSAATYDTVGP